MIQFNLLVHVQGTLATQSITYLNSAAQRIAMHWEFTRWVSLASHDMNSLNTNWDCKYLRRRTYCVTATHGH